MSHNVMQVYRHRGKGLDTCWLSACHWEGLSVEGTGLMAVLAGDDR